MKRLIDFVFAVVIILLSIPVFLLACVAIYLDDGAPVIFRQIRVGKLGRVFQCYKFRTMTLNIGDHPSHRVDIKAITRIGRTLRKYKIDELPQLFNVLEGTMSLVGPRPCLPLQMELVELRKKNGVLTVLPGITGLSQIRGIDMSTPAALVNSDKEYVHSQSLLFDLKILAATIMGKGLNVDAAKTKNE
jgi:O-antigen biosynthesis protein WbqP